ncbi:hypothetical protein F5B22DRAFT_386611 [Xylaria bambusicola]|uniref:uncharacterized protein n=1 Tax=Xylaria bambusicola TaxID=326684 RepID=UPI002007D769|nr:uncharacterized protein F5B22DRAFT_386611 [Xylaria bambusicola]KAI0508665.1 hypothetical protein F5B22DRAFT_386611 [Xylaria bambusicola]
MQNNQVGTGPLEDRLRNLILAGSDSKPAPLPASSSKATFTGTHALPSEHSDQPKDEVVGDGHGHSRPPPRGGRKRLNQAQRRQMNAELTIPIDTRPPFHASSRPSHYAQQQTASPSRNTTAYPANFRGQSSLSDASQFNRQSRYGHPQFPTSSAHQPDWRRQQHDGLPRGVNIMTEPPFTSQSGRNPIHSQPASYNPGSSRLPVFSPDQLASQSLYLDQLSLRIIEGAEIGPDEISEKENFRLYVESICRHVITCHEHEVNLAHEFQPRSVELKCFGSLASGFATKAADMDLGLVSPTSRLSPGSPESPIPRLIEGALLAAGFGARLLTKTRVPIIKLCEKPSIALRRGLLDARKKWEEGADQEERELDDDDPEDTDLLQDTNLPFDSNLTQPYAEESTSKTSSDQTPLSLHEEGVMLKQSLNQTLTSYYGKAKRLLRRLNSRDISQSNCHDFTEADFVLLDKVASAFVKGLHDAELRSRILAYPSFNVGDTGLTNYRSLFGVNVMIECEQLILSWEAKQLTSASPRSDQACESIIQQWRALHHIKNFGNNPVWFNKELQLFAETIRQNPSIQMMQLHQDQHESPMQYQARTNKIAIALPQILLPSMISQTIQRYVDGIRDEEIRNEVRNFLISTKTENLRTVARRHKALHLAADYERAIEKGLYTLDDIPTLQSYITILRRQPVPSMKQPRELECLIPLTESEKSILYKIRELADPATLGPNKPRDKYNDSLEFPKSGVGVQCDINFSAHLALQNTLLLRCYSCTDRRVRPLVLFVKHWAKARGINTPYRGTLSSYGYVLMVLHYLVNVVEPFVCPNLQELAPPDPPNLPPHALEGISTCQGRNIRFWRDERAIQSLAQQGQLNQNHDSLGTLLQGFFEYYAQGNTMSTTNKKGFNWGRDVISLRTHGGLLTKVEKSWTGAKTVVQPQTGASPTHPELGNQSPSLHQPISPDKGAMTTEQLQQTPKPKKVKEVRHRFLFAIEDPFELDHNVARTVTHNGIVSIRDEFRRAWRIIKTAGNGKVNEDLLEDVKVQKADLEKKQFMALLDEIHGDEVFEL